MSEKKVTLAHGAGGRQTSELIHSVFQKHFANPYFTADDAATLTLPGSKIAMTTDGFIVSPYRFPGGNIGKLSICGTVNDLACMGARPLYLTCGFVIEEGYPLDQLREIAEAMAKTAAEAGVTLVAGDTKVAGRGQVDGVFISIGRKPATELLEGQLKLEGGYIVADESAQTSIPGVYAVGDVRTKALRQIITAASDGANAAHHAEEWLSEMG